jgi:hypothetical protein
MPDPAPPRRTGILSAWDEEKLRGTVLVPETNELFFICKRFIITGGPIVGSKVTFAPRPAAQGYSFPQAAFAIIDSRSESTRAVAAPSVKERAR